MNKTQAEERIRAKLRELGLPETHTRVRRVPSQIECEVVLGSFHHKFSARSGVSEADLERELLKIETAWTNAQGGRQVHLEDAIEAAE